MEPQMTALTLFPFSFLAEPVRTSEPKVADDDSIDDAERLALVSEMIAAGACDSEYGVQMMMSVFPGRF